MARSTFEDFKVLGECNRIVVMRISAESRYHIHRQDRIGKLWSRLQSSPKSRPNGLCNEGDRSAWHVEKGEREHDTK